MRYTYMMRVGTHVRSLMLYQDGTLPYNTEKVETVKQKLADVTIQLYNTQTYLSDNEMGLSSKHKELTSKNTITL